MSQTSMSSKADLITLIIVSIYVGIILISALGGFILYFIEYMLLSIALYNMAYYIGYDHPFMAYIPIARIYLLAMLPETDYSFLGLFRKSDRSVGFWIYLIGILLPFVLNLLAIAFAFIPILGYLLLFVIRIITLVVGVMAAISLVILRIDLLKMYYEKGSSTPYLVGILTLFCPIVYSVWCLCICKKEPHGGFDNYYNLSLEEEE